MYIIFIRRYGSSEAERFSDRYDSQIPQVCGEPVLPTDSGGDAGDDGTVSGAPHNTHSFMPCFLIFSFGSYFQASQQSLLAALKSAPAHYHTLRAMAQVTYLIGPVPANPSTKSVVTVEDRTDAALHYLDQVHICTCRMDNIVYVFSLRA